MPVIGNIQKWQCLNKIMTSEKKHVIFCADFNAKVNCGAIPLQTNKENI